MVKYFAVILSVTLWVVSADVAKGYEIVSVRNGATVKGRVNFKGAVPSDERIIIKKDVEYCGKEQMAGKYVIAGSGVKNVVVWLDGVEKGKAIPKTSVTVTIKKCRVEPHVSVGFIGGEYVFRNDDGILHTVQSKLGLAYQKQASARPLSDGASIYNIALPKRGLEVRKPIKKWHRYTEQTGFIQVRSNTHNWIRGYIFIFDHPYAAVTDERGTFVMKNLSPGEYTLRAWHEGFGMQSKKIVVKSDEPLEVEIDFSE